MEYLLRQKAQQLDYSLLHQRMIFNQKNYPNKMHKLKKIINL